MYQRHRLFYWSVLFLLISGASISRAQSQQEEEFRIYAPPGHYVLEMLDDNELHVRKYVGDEKVRELIDRRVFDLSRESEKNRAKTFLSTLGIDDSKIQTSTLLHLCRDSSSLSVLPPAFKKLVANVGDIQGNIFAKFQSEGVPSELIKSTDQTLIARLELFSQNVPVEIRLGENGKIEQIDWKNSQRAEQEGLSLEKIRDEDGGLRWAVKVKGVDIPLLVFEEGTLDSKSAIKILTIGEKLPGPLNRHGFKEAYYPIRKDENGKLKNALRHTVNESGLSFKKARIHRVEDEGWLSNSLFFIKDKGIESWESIKKAGMSAGFWASPVDSREGLVKGVINSSAEEAILQNDSIAGYFTDSDIKEITQSIAEEIKQETGFEGSLEENEPLIRKRSYLRFAREVTKRLVDDHLAEYSPHRRENIQSDLTTPLKECLESGGWSDSRRQSDVCLKRFEIYLPERLIKHVLDAKLASEGIAHLRPSYSKTYKECIRKREMQGIPRDDHAKYAQACLYKAITLSVDQAAPGKIRENWNELSDSSREEMTPEDYQKVLSEGRKCLKEEGLIQRVDSERNQIKVEATELDHLSGEDYESRLRKCLDTYTSQAGRVITDKILQGQLASFLSGQKESLKEIKETVLSDGYDRCTEKMRTSSVEAFDPVYCKPLVENRAIWHSTKAILKERMGMQNWEEWRPSAEFQKAKNCFSRVGSEHLDEVVNDGRNDESMERTSTENAECLKNFIVDASKQVAKGTLKEKIKNIDGGENIDLKESQLNQFAAQIEACFAENLSQYIDIDKITESQSKLADVCAVKMLNGEAFNNQVIFPLMKGSLNEAGIQGEQKNRYAKLLQEDFKKFTNNAQTVDEFISLSDDYRSKGVLKVIDLNVRDQLKASVENEADIDEILAKFRKNVLTGPKSYEKRILRSVQEGEDLQNVLDPFKRDSLKYLTNEVLQIEGEKLLEQELLTKKEIADFVEQGNKKLRRCLKDRSATESLDELTEKCLDKLKKETTLWVIETNLEREMNAPTVGPYLTEREKEEFKNEILDNQMLKLVTDAANSESDLAVSKLAHRLKVRGFKVIGPSVYKEMLRENLAMTENASEEKTSLVSKLVNEFEVCLNALDPSEPDGPPPHLCLNRARRKASVKLLGTKFRDILSPLIGDDEKMRQFLERALNKGEKKLAYCHGKISEQTDSQKYETLSTQCVKGSTLDMVSAVVDWFEFDGRRRGILPEDMNAKKKFTECEEKLKNSEVGLTEFQQRLNQCLQETTFPYMLEKLADKLSARSQKEGVWGEKEGVLFQTLMDETSKILPLSSQIQIEDQQERTPSQETSEENPSAMETLERFIPDIQDYLSGVTKVTDDGPALASRAMEKVENRLQAAKERGEKVSRRELIDELLNSDFGDHFILGSMAMEVKNRADEALSKFVPDDEKRRKIVRELASKDVMKKTFPLSSGKTKKLFERIKDDYIIPIIEGEAEPGQIPSSVMTEVENLLASSSEVGAFTETLMGPIIQERLDEKSMGIPALFGRLFGIVDGDDFEWKHLRKKEGAQKIIRLFSREFLRPALGGDFTEREYNKAEENFIEEMKELIKEDG